MFELKFFDKDDPMNACIIDVDNMTTDDIKKILAVQHTLGRNELEFIRGDVPLPNPLTKIGVL